MSHSVDYIAQYNAFCEAQRKVSPRRYRVSQGSSSREVGVSELAQLLMGLDNEHAEPVADLAVGAEHEVEQMAGPHLYIERVS